MTASPRELAQAVIERGSLLLKEGDNRAAILAFTYALSLHTPCAEARFLISRACRAEGRIREALGHIREAMREEPANPEYLSFEADLTELARSAVDSVPKPTPARPGVGLEAAVVPPKMMAKTHPETKRLLVSIDYSSQPYNIGDLIIYLHTAMIFARTNELPLIDICFISDPARPPIDENIAKLVSSENRLLHLFSIIPIVQLMPSLGTVAVFESWQEYQAYVTANSDRYLLWPSEREINGREYMFYKAFRLISEYHRKHGHVPRLSFCSDLLQWCDTFFHECVYPHVPVTVNLRNNRSFHNHRNSYIPAWREFFIDCSSKYPAKFVITCSLSEVDESLRNLPNVIFAKEHGTTLLQDLSLIQHSAFHLGSPSGPAALALFKSAPYYIANCDMQPHIANYGGVLRQESDGGLRFDFATPLQRYGTVKETPKLLAEEFEKIWKSNDWASQAASRAADGFVEKRFVTWL